MYVMHVDFVILNYENKNNLIMNNKNSTIIYVITYYNYSNNKVEIIFINKSSPKTVSHLYILPSKHFNN